MSESRRPGVGIRRWLKARLDRHRQPSGFPPWIDAGFAREHGLQERWNAWHVPRFAREHPLRPEACRRLITAPWSWYFEAFDPGTRRIAVEIRYPFLDLRVVEYVLALPPVPWSVDKHLLRVAMRGMLPDVIRKRPKSPLAANPLLAHLRRTGGDQIDRFEAVPELEGVVDRKAIPSIAEASNGVEAESIVRPYCLNHWLRREDIRQRTAKERSHVERTVVSAG
jgi:asparagine synthase (glutamine-hydrolysing)